MQATISHGACLPHKAADSPGLAIQQLCLVPARRRSRPRSIPTTAFGAAAAVGGAGVGASQLASFLGCALAAAWVGLQLKMEQDAIEQQEGRRECDTCSGTGRVPCICLRWSDRDVGCGACAGSGQMECTSCGGGGTAVPIEAKVYVKGPGQQGSRGPYY